MSRDLGSRKRILNFSKQILTLSHINIPKVTSEARNDVKTRREKAPREGHARKLPKEKETRLIQVDEIHGQKEESVGKVVVHEVETGVYEKSKNVIFYFVQFF